MKWNIDTSLTIKYIKKVCFKALYDIYKKKEKMLAT